MLVITVTKKVRFIGHEDDSAGHSQGITIRRVVESDTNTALSFPKLFE